MQCGSRRFQGRIHIDLYNFRSITVEGLRGVEGVRKVLSGFLVSPAPRILAVWSGSLCVKRVLAIVVGHSIAGVTLTLETGDSVGVWAVAYPCRLDDLSRLMPWMLHRGRITLRTLFTCSFDWELTQIKPTPHSFTPFSTHPCILNQVSNAGGLPFWFRILLRLLTCSN